MVLSSEDSERFADRQRTGGPPRTRLMSLK
jgi:hypothetical protein